MSALSKQEYKIVNALSYEMKYSEIAEHYLISINTVKKHLKNAYRKMKVTNRKDAIKKFHTHETSSSQH